MHTCNYKALRVWFYMQIGIKGKKIKNSHLKENNGSYPEFKKKIYKIIRKKKTENTKFCCSTYRVSVKICPHCSAHFDLNILVLFFSLCFILFL